MSVIKRVECYTFDIITSNTKNISLYDYQWRNTHVIYFCSFLNTTTIS